jgi:hypothetical protein
LASGFWALDFWALDFWALGPLAFGPSFFRRHIDGVNRSCRSRVGDFSLIIQSLLLRPMTINFFAKKSNK